MLAEIISEISPDMAAGRSISSRRLMPLVEQMRVYVEKENRRTSCMTNTKIFPAKLIGQLDVGVEFREIGLLLNDRHG